MKYILSFFIMISFIFTSADAFTQNYASIHNTALSKKYASNEFGYYKDSNSFVFYTIFPNENKYIQDKDDIIITTRFGKIKFISEKTFILTTYYDTYTINFDNKDISIKGEKYKDILIKDGKIPKKAKININNNSITIKYNNEALTCKFTAETENEGASAYCFIE